MFSQEDDVDDDRSELVAFLNQRIRDLEAQRDVARAEVIALCAQVAQLTKERDSWRAVASFSERLARIEY